jgi:hypothetical protein
VRLVRLDQAGEEGHEGLGLGGRERGQQALGDCPRGRPQSLAEGRAGRGRVKGPGAAVARRDVARDEAARDQPVERLPGGGGVPADGGGEAGAVEARRLAHLHQERVLPGREVVRREDLGQPGVADLQEAAGEVLRDAVDRRHRRGGGSGG